MSIPGDLARVLSTRKIDVLRASGPLGESVDDQLVSGMFALAGALMGGLISYATTRIDRRWDRVQRDIARLCDQVSAYYQLEQMYKAELARLDPAGRSEKTILEDMRSRVEKSGDFERPSMTSLAASKLRREWV
jgi:hypothetical protein